MSDSIITSAAVRKVLYILATIWNLGFGAFVLLNAYYGWFPPEEVAVWGTAATFVINSPALGLAAANTNRGTVLEALPEWADEVGSADITAAQGGE